ncbi:MAG: hypothetical protein NVS9B4_00270 [Candidatus Acidiferrum sp.]
MKIRQAIAATLVAMLFLATASSTTAPPVSVDTTVLQSAVNAYASAGLSASCGTYVTRNIGTTSNPDGVIVNNVCRVQGDTEWHDANIAAQMTGAQLKVGLGSSGRDPTVLTDDPGTTQISPTISKPTTSHEPMSSIEVSNAVDKTLTGVNKAMIATSAGCSAAGALNAFFLGGAATEITQLCVHAQLLADSVANVKHLNAFTDSMRALPSRAPYATAPIAMQPHVGNDINGELAALSGILNGRGGDAQAAWANATVRLRAAYLNHETAGTSAQLSSAASINMVDSFGTEALRVIGEIRANQAASLAAAAALQKQADSLDPAINTPIGQQNITNAALMQLIHLHTTSQATAAALLQQMAVANTWQRNAAATAANNYEVMMQARAAKSADLMGTSSALAYRMP